MICAEFLLYSEKSNEFLLYTEKSNENKQHSETKITGQEMEFPHLSCIHKVLHFIDCFP